MDKTVTLAVAGSGKTRSIVEKINLSRRTLVITYTTNTEQDLRKRICEKLGGLPETVTISSYFSFLNRFCFKPFLQAEMRSRGISFSVPSQISNRMPLMDRRRYMDGDRVYHCRMGKLIAVRNCLPELLDRLNRYYDDVFVDEVQDFGGHDFNFLLELSKACARFHFVGDFYQHTFSTSHDGIVNKSLHKDYAAYCQRLTKSGFSVDANSLATSYRCSKAVCDYISTTLGISIRSAEINSSQVHVVESPVDVDRLHSDPDTVKLFLKQHWVYGCNSHNWGACKGLDHYKDVCVVLNDTTWKQFSRGEMSQVKSIIRNKLYVACSRARGNLFIVPEKMFKKHKYSE